jgi:hypothetical protein
MADTPKTNLLELVARRFDVILPAERKLYDAALEGKDADCTSLRKEDRKI